MRQGGEAVSYQCQQFRLIGHLLQGFEQVREHRFIDVLAGAQQVDDGALYMPVAICSKRGGYACQYFRG